MKLITRDTDYALRALALISGYKNRVVSVAEMVKTLNMPRPFLRKILQRLNKKDVLKSYKGRGGGFTLALPANKVLFLDLIEIFQGPFQINECTFKKKACPNKSDCRLRRRIAKVETHIFSELKGLTLASL